MSKQTGLGDNCYIGGYNLSGDIGSLQRIAGGPRPLNVTGIDKSGYERIGGVRDGGLTFNAFFNDSAGQAHPVLSALPTADVVVGYWRSTTAGKPAACCVAKQVNYDPTRATDGSLTCNVDVQANGYGLEWGVQLVGGMTQHTTATTATSIDLGTASPGAFGLQAYLQVKSFTGTSATFTIQESSDNGAGDAFAAVVGGAFAAVSSAPQTQRIATAAINVERYLRVVSTGTFSECTFAIMVVRNDTLTAF